MHKLQSGRFMSVVTEYKSTVQIEGGEDIQYAFPSSAIIYDRTGTALFTLSAYRISSYLVSPFIEDSQGNIITIQLDGIVSYDKNGHKKWVFNEGIIVKPEILSNISTNIYFMDSNLDGILLVRTKDRELKISADGKLLSSKPYKIVRYEYNENSYFELIVNEEGLVEVDNQYLTPEEVVEYSKKLWENYYPLRTVSYWSKGSYVIVKGSTIQSKDLQGKIKWTYKLSKFGPPTNLTSDPDGNLFFSDSKGNIYGLDAKGNEKFQLIRNFSHASKDWTSLVLDAQGDLYGVTANFGFFLISKRHENVLLNGKPIALGNKPIVKSSTFLVPYRSLFEGLHLTVQSDSSKKWIIGKSSNGKTIRFQTGNSIVEVNGKPLKLDVAPQIINGVTYIPIQPIAQMLGLKMEWDKLRNEVRLGSENQLVTDAVRRFLLLVEQGEEPLINDQLDIKGSHLGEKAPALKTLYRSEKWIIDVKSIKATKIKKNEYHVETIQHNQKYDGNDTPSIDIERSYYYQVKLGADGRWKITSSSFFK